MLIAGVSGTWGRARSRFRFRDGRQENGIAVEDAIARIREAIDTHVQV